MKRIPGGREVARSLRSAAKGIRSGLKDLNRQAAKLLSSGDYSAAEEIVALARSLAAFQAELDSVRKRWHEVEHGGRPSSGSPADPVTPLWKYYAPTLRMLISLGGAAKRRDIECAFEADANHFFPESDHKPLRGRPRWKIMLQRSLYAMSKEGFLQREGKQWRITPEGRTASEADLSQGASSTKSDASRR